jgi:hypothetical protein
MRRVPGFRERRSVRDAHMDNKVLLLCLLVAIITALAELSPTPRREASRAPQPQQ